MSVQNIAEASADGCAADYCWMHDYYSNDYWACVNSSCCGDEVLGCNYNCDPGFHLDFMSATCVADIDTPTFHTSVDCPSGGNGTPECPSDSGITWGCSLISHLPWCPPTTGDDGQGGNGVGGGSASNDPTLTNSSPLCRIFSNLNMCHANPSQETLTLGAGDCLREGDVCQVTCPASASGGCTLGPDGMKIINVLGAVYVGETPGGVPVDKARWLATWLGFVRDSETGLLKANRALFGLKWFLEMAPRNWVDYFDLAGEMIERPDYRKIDYISKLVKDMQAAVAKHGSNDQEVYSIALMVTTKVTHDLDELYAFMGRAATATEILVPEVGSITARDPLLSQRLYNFLLNESVGFGR